MIKLRRVGLVIFIALLLVFKADTPVQAQAANLKLQYKAADTVAGDNQFKPHFNIVNLRTTTVNLSTLKIRYYFTRDNAAGLTFNCDWAQIGCGNLSGIFPALSPAATNADTYLEIGFSAGAGSIAAGGQTGDIQARINHSDWTNFNESNDYSFDPTKTAYADWTRVTLYENGTLIWGTPPGGTTPTTVPPTATTVPTTTVPPTGVPPTATRTNTPLGPTATRTNTPVGPTPTRTNTRTNTPVPTSGGNDGSPFGGTAAVLPGTVQAENFNTGGQNIAFNDTTTGNSGNQYRTTEAVDIETTTDTGGGYNVGWTTAGEWLKYTVNVQTAGTYTFTFRVASAMAGGSFNMEVDGVNVTGTLTIPNTGGWQTWTNVTRTGVNLTAGQHVLRLVMVTANGNFNWFSATSGTVPTNTPVQATATRTNTPIGPTPTRTNTPIQPTSTRTNTPIGATNTPLPTTTAGCNSPADCVSKMTLDEKIGQMTQANKAALTNIADVRTYFLGSVLSGGGEGPNGPGGSASQWADMHDNFQNQALQTRLKIPMIYGVDAVHGHNSVTGAVVFPHHIGMGATRNTTLMQQAEDVTRQEVLGTGIRWSFAPCICVPRDDRWGRTYEGFSEDPTLVSQMGVASIRGFQGTALGPNSVLATAKHYVGDGGTTWGTGSGTYQIDQGNTQLTETELRAIHLAPYVSAVQAGVGSVMASYSSWNGQKMHGHQYLMTTVLKGELGFSGFIVSDWAGIDQLPGAYAQDVRDSINAGIDMVMVPSAYTTFISTLRNEINAGNIPMSRINDAVTRILTVKFALGLFQQPLTNRTFTSQVGSSAHRAVARQAVRESLVLLKNTNTALPLSKTGTYRLIVGGSHINDIGLQSGGWTISWQGSAGNTTTGTTLLQAIQQTVSGTVTVQNVGTATGGTYSGDVGIVAIGESPYAEGQGDSSTLAISAANAQQVTDICSRVTKCIVILFSGRPMIINTQLNDAEAFVAAWLPGTEGLGITDVLFGDFGFVGKLPMTWPNAVSQQPINAGDGKTGLFPFGFGISPY